MIYRIPFLRYMVFSFAAIVQSCSEPDPLSTLSPAEKDVIVTNRDKSIDFGNYKTYAIVDTVSVINKNVNINDTSSGRSQYSALILNTVNKQLQKDGYVRVSKNQAPDLGINVSVLRFSEQVPVQYFGFVSGYGYYGYPSATYWGFPNTAYGVPSYYQYYTIEVGSVSIEMFDLKTARAGNKNLNLIWDALLVGSITDSAALDPGRISGDIETAFNQSPYLAK